MHRTTLGDFELTVFSDGNYFLDGGAFFGVVPKAMWSKKVKADEKNLVPVGLNSLLVRSGENVLIETGIGNKLSEKMARIYGQPAQLLDNLHAAGVAPEDIDIVINTHLHFDHCGWNTVRGPERVVPTFPKAKYYVQEGEWQHARRQFERDRISYISDNYDPLIETGQMELLRGDRQIVPESYVKQATTASAHGPDYGFLWWLNTTGKEWPGSPTSSFEARGSGGNIIYVDPTNDLVVIWRWSSNSAQGFRKVVESIVDSR